MKRTIQTLLAALLALTASAPAGETDWPMLAHDAARTNGTSVGVAPPYKVTWVWYGDATTKLGGPYPKRHDEVPSHFTQPVVSNGRVYVGTMTGRVFCIDAETGRNLWDAATGGPVMNSAAVADGRVFFCSTDGFVRAHDAASGKELWKFRTGAPLICSPLPVENKVFVCGRDGNLYALSATDGRELWRFRADAPCAGSCAYAEGTVYFASHGAVAYAVDAAGGKEVWRFQMRGQDPWYWPVVVGDVVMFRTKSAVNGPEQDGTNKLLASLPDECDNWPPANWPAERKAILDHLDRNPDEQSFFALERRSGKLKWTPPITRVVGHNDCPYPPAISPDGKAYTLFRVRSSRLKGALSFGTPYPPDICQIDLTTGDRIPLDLPANNKLPGGNRIPSLSLDNPKVPTFGGGYLYLYHNSTGSFALDLKTGRAHGIVRYGKDPTPVVGGTTFLYKRGKGDWGLGPDAPKTPMRLINISSCVVPADGALFIHVGYAGCLVRVDNAGTKTSPVAVSPPREHKDKQQPIAAGKPEPAEKVVAEPSPVGKLPAQAEPIRKKLIEQVEKVLRAGHLAPAYFLSGESGVDAARLFDSPADSVWALSEALPYLPEELKRRTVEYLRKELTANPPWETDRLDMDSGAKREYFPILPANRLRVRLFGQLKEAHLRRLYALWLFARNAGADDYVRTNWAAIREYASRAGREMSKHGPVYADITGLIGLARLAKMAGDEAMAKATVEQLSRQAALLGSVDGLRKGAGKVRTGGTVHLVRMDIDVHRAGAGVLFADLTADTVRLLDRAPLLEHQRDIDWYLPAWFLVTGGPTYGNHVFNEGCSMPPMIAAGYFQLHAWAGKAPPEKLAGWIDTPCCRVRRLLLHSQAHRDAAQVRRIKCGRETIAFATREPRRSGGPSGRAESAATCPPKPLRRHSYGASATWRRRNKREPIEHENSIVSPD